MPPLLFYPSVFLSKCLFILHGCAILCLVFSQTSGWLKIIAILLSSYSAWHTQRKYARLSHPKAIVGSKILIDGRWQLTTRQGTEETVFLLGNSYQSRWILILNFKSIDSQKRWSILLYQDMLEPSALRRLRVYLNFSAKTNA